jgi:hypothetical protein
MDSMTSTLSDPCGQRDRALLLSSAAWMQTQRERTAVPEAGDALRGEAIGYVRELAGLYLVDPTLSGDRHRTRSVDLAAELARQLVPLVVQCYQDPALTRRATEETWALVGDLMERLRTTMTAARAAVRPDWDQPEVCREISRARTVQSCGQVEEAATSAAAALRSALALPHPAPEAVELAALAAQLLERARQVASGV